MRNISDIIEHYLKTVLQESHGGMIEIQRNDLADRFSCVPSQINYVISTRFTLEKGYLVESKRGGGGYIRIQRIDLPMHSELHAHVHETIGSEMSQSAAEGLIYRLVEANLITGREAALMRSAVLRNTLLLKLPYRDEMRARIMKAMLIALMGQSD
ncbi:CtsR family transcriptional regulator [Saccharibacillus brassicae]|jgi:transcriptional regulator CtsR|uniref:Transcriptional regulator CtsR n=1 Tax=Saccharibacillus brassicae TaxID=2583377 RepID=A0A4Y6UWH2_SACBS|nr:CtsR family transcriptional regulator [Saccharibacillus brassicae]QDH20766.1 CtsR family transcriptional regulator [Saccharibacillus brassicae]